jgi:integrase
MPRRKRAARKQRITELTVRKARPQAKAFLTWDTKAPNLALRTQPTGHKSWTVVYSRSGRSRWLTLGPASSIPLETARIMTAEAMLAVAKGKDPAADKRAERGAGTFAELADRHLEYAKKHNKSWPQAAALVARHAIPRWKKLQASAITRGDVKAMLAKIGAPITSNQVLASVSAIYSWGVKEEIVLNNPCRGIDRNDTKSRERILSDSEIPTFWKAFGDSNVGLALKAILLTGQRPGECANMRREHVVDGWWNMPGEPVPGIWPGTKNGQSHRVWLPVPVQKLIANDKTSGFVFAGARGRPARGLDEAMREIVAKLGVADKVVPHDLRRTHGSTITALGFGRDAMNRVQNHKEGGIASVYDRHEYADENKRVMEAVASKIMSLIEPTTDANVIHGEFGGR